MRTNDLIKIVDVTKTLTAIVLEDEPETNELMCSSFEHFFNKVYSALEGETALELYKRHQPDIIFIDILLPGKNGLEVAKEIKNINPKQIIVIVSESNNMGDISEAVKIGVNNFIRKPMDADKMIDVLSEIISEIKRKKKEFKKMLKKKLKKELKKELKEKQKRENL